MTLITYRLSSFLCLYLCLACASGVWATDHYVAPNGSATGNGSIDQPWDLETALGSHSTPPPSVQPGDTIWLRGGVYRPSTTNGFISHLFGTATNPITVRNYAGERATLDGGADAFALSVNGSYTWYWGLEVMDFVTTRFALQPGSDANPNAYGVAVYGPGNKFINMIVHDTAQGFSAYAASPDSEFYGNLVYYNGWIGPDRNHGHGMYMQNATGIKLLSDNFAGDNADEGLQIYASELGSIVGFRILGNALYNTSSWPVPHFQYNLLIAGGRTRADIQVDSTYSFFDPTTNQGYIQFGNETPGLDLRVTNSVFAGGYLGPAFGDQAGPVTFAQNKIYTQPSAAREITIVQNSLGEMGQALAAYTWDRNTYYGNSLFYWPGGNGSFPVWQSRTGFDVNSSFSASPPTGIWTYVRPNKYEPKRANIIIYNWDLAPAVSVDLSGVLSPGDFYVIVDAQNFYGAPIESGMYKGGTVAIPMTGLMKETPIGFSTPAHTAPLYGTFIVMPILGTASNPISSQPLTVTISNPVQGTSVSGVTSLDALVSGTMIAGVQFQLDGQNLGPRVAMAPYSLTWDTTSISNGSHTLTAISFDSSGNRAFSTDVNVLVNNPRAVPAPSLVSISIAPASLTALPGITQQFTATGRYSDGQTQDLTNAVQWTSSLPSVAVISSEGLATVQGFGNTTITAGISGSASLTGQPVPSVPSSQLPNDMVLRWTFDSGDITGRTIRDKSGNNRQGAILGNFMAAQGKVNEAMAFDGTDSYVSLGTSDASAAAFYRDLTLCAWINTTNASRTEAVFSKFTAAGTAYGYIVYVDQDGKANLRVGGENVTEYPIVVTDSAKINDGQWHHVAVVISLGQNAQFYVDGRISSTSVMHTFAGGDGGSSLNIGVSQWIPYGDYFTGSIDEVQIYGRALGADEVKAVYNLTGGKP